MDALPTISKLSGYLSLTIWLFAQLPQIIENHLNQSVEGVNGYFLSSWIAGDVSNLVGCLLTRALPFQTLIATYYCFIDVILSFQFYYYTRISPYHKTPHNLLQSPNMMRHLSYDRINEHTNLLSPTRSHPSPRRSSFVSKVLSAGLLAQKTGKVRGLPIGDVAVEQINPSDIGKVVAWTCTFFYLSARLPQIKTNFQNKSTSGISPYLFLFAMLGNTFYTISITSDLLILYYNNDSALLQTFWDQLPFIIGSGGTVFFDCIILIQCWYYRHNAKLEPKVYPMPTEYPEWYSNNLLYEQDSRGNIAIESSPAPHHYITGSGNSYQPNSVTSFSFTRPKSIHKSIRSNSSSIHSPMYTSLIPSIVNSYSSVSKKMATDKTPFSPSDFLADNFHTPIENSSFSLNNS